MIVVKRRENEKQEAMINRFNKLVMANNVTKEYRDKMYFTSKTEKKQKAEKRKQWKIRKTLEQEQ